MNRPWIAHYDPGVRPTLDYPDLTLPQIFDRAADRYPDQTATVFHGAKRTYAQLKGSIDAFAGGLHAAGIRRGDRVALMLPNLPQFIVAFYGSLRAGAIVVPTNPLYTPHELEYQLADAGAAAVVTIDQLFSRVQTALPATQVRTVILTSIGSALPPHLRPLYELQQRRQGQRAVPAGGVVRRFEDLLSSSPLESPVDLTPDDLAVLQYTGGTTGRAKGAMLSHRNLVANALQVHEWHGSSHDERFTVLCAAPFFHVYGLTVGMNLSIVSGATMLLVPRFIPKEVAKVIQKYRPELFPGVPTMYVALENLPSFSRRRFDSLQICISGAAPLPREVARRFEEATGARLVEGYGLTEAGPVTHCNPVFGDCRSGSVGVPFPDTDAIITDPDTWEPLPPGTLGELTVSGPQVMQGYWNRPEETASVLRDGWLRTGDLGVMSDDGYFTLVDRKKDVIIAGGYNIYPGEVEEVLAGHPKIREVAVIGVPSAYRGETVKAVVVLKEGTQATAEEIAAFCRQQLAVYKVPEIVEFADDLPKTLIGKILRRELRTEPRPARSPEPLPPPAAIARVRARSRRRLGMYALAASLATSLVLGYAGEIKAYASGLAMHARLPRVHGLQRVPSSDSNRRDQPEEGSASTPSSQEGNT